MRKRDTMKLSVLLDSLIGQELTSANVAAISSEVDGIKTRATEKMQTELDKSKGDLKESQKKVTEFESTQKDVILKEAFVKAGGNEKKFESFKKVAGKVDDVEKFNFKETFKEFTSLAGKGTDTSEDEPEFENKDISNKSTEEADSGDGESGEVGSLMA